MTPPSAAALQEVAVIGGGAAGLACARVLSRHGLQPVVLEQARVEGGVWHYDETPHDDGKKKKNKPMYRNLKTNLPREIMAYREKPWNARTGPGDKSYVTHRDVLTYLHDYKRDFGLDRYITYGATVTQLTVLSSNKDDDEQVDDSSLSWPRIQLTWQQEPNDDNDDNNNPSPTNTLTQTFDAVCVCNGHYATPSIPKLPGLDTCFRGTRILHAVEYDDPRLFENQTVLCVGARASGSDLARDIAQFATHVYLSDSTCTSSNHVETQGRVTRVPRTLRVAQDGRIVFDANCEVRPLVDAIIFCSGYEYDFPFVNGKSNLELGVGDRRVMPLYRQLWHARYTSLAFVGLPHSVVPFPLFELQAEAVVEQLLLRQRGSDTLLPSLAERVQEAQKDAALGGYKQERRVQDTHYLGSGQWDYCREMAKLAGIHTNNVANYIATNQAIYDHSGKERKSLFPGGPDTYRQTCYERDDAQQSFRVTSSGISNAASMR